MKKEAKYQHHAACGQLIVIVEKEKTGLLTEAAGWAVVLSSLVVLSKFSALRVQLHLF